MNLGFSEHFVRAEAVYSVLALSAFKAGPFAARAIGVIPRNRKTEVMIEKKEFHKLQSLIPYSVLSKKLILK